MEKANKKQQKIMQELDYKIDEYIKHMMMKVMIYTACKHTITRK